MLEIFAGWIIGASMMVLFLHFAGRLTPRHPETYTGSDVGGISAVGVSWDRKGQKLDPFYRRKLEEVLPELKGRL